MMVLSRTDEGPPPSNSEPVQIWSMNFFAKTTPDISRQASSALRKVFCCHLVVRILLGQKNAVTSMMEAERKLLQDVISLRVPARDVNEWLEDSFEGNRTVEEDSKHACRFSKFERYEPLSFVVVLLNFVREDSAPILTYVERSQVTDPATPASTAKEGAGAKSSVLTGMSPMKAFDISSVEEFPSLSTTGVPRRTRLGPKQKRRIRPTPLNDSDKPIEGDITLVGTNAAQTSSRMDDAATGRSPICVQRSDYLHHNGSSSSSSSRAKIIPSVQVIRQPKSDTVIITCEDAPVQPSHFGGTSPSLTRLTTPNKDDQGYDDCADDPSNLREATCGSTLISPSRLRRRDVVDVGAETNFKETQRCFDNTSSCSTLSRVSSMREGAIVNTVRARESTADEAWLRRMACLTTTDTAEGFSCANPRFSMTSQLYPLSPKGRYGHHGQQYKHKSSASSGNVPATPPPGTPSTPYLCTPTTEIESGKEDPGLVALASIYVYMMMRRLVPSLATEIHLTVRLLHVRPDVTCGDVHKHLGHSKHLVAERGAVDGRSLIRGKTDEGGKEINSYIKKANGKSDKDDQDDHLRETINTLFKTGMDCRSFAARVLLGLKSLLPHVGADMLDLLEGSLAYASQTGEQSREARMALCQARVVRVKPARKSLDNRDPDDTAIVQTMGAPFAALQWQQHDSVNQCRTSLERTLFQNRQECVDRFGSLLRDYQASKKGLQRGAPATVLHDLRTAALALIGTLAPENLGWLARYFLAQLVGWGLAPPEETDSDLMALVAPAGEKGRANLQKLHRRISAPTCAEDGNASKSSQKLRLPRTQLDPAHAEKTQRHHDHVRVHDGASHNRRGGRGGGTKVPQVRSRKAAAAQRHSTEQMPRASVRVPTAPLQLHWFPGNQEFFYHFLLVSDSHTFNVHLKAQLAREITRLYEQEVVLDHDGDHDHNHGRNKKGRDQGEDDHQGHGHDHDHGEKNISWVAEGAEGETSIRDGVTGFTGTMSKLKVLSKFLGLLTFSPSWGVSSCNNEDGDDDVWRRRECDNKAHCLLPLIEYLEQSWVTEGLIGAVPWMAEFLRMMKWDERSSKTEVYSNVLDMLASIHSQPCMRPEHPAFTEALFAVSCEVENLFQDLGSDLGVQGFRLCSSSNVVGSSEMSTSRPRRSRDSQRHLSSRRSTRPKQGSLDAEVVLSRRLIQNCCPFLEEVLTLIEILDRAWRQGSAQGGEGTPFESNVVSTPSGRVRRTTGASPRTKRTIKPHPLKPIPVLPSVPEQQLRRGSAGNGSGIKSEYSQTQSARLRLIETFFHSLPDEVQATADFVVRHAVHNACEDTLATVIRPAIATAISKLRESLGQPRNAHRSAHPSDKLSSGILARGTSRNIHDELKLRGHPEKSSASFYLEHTSASIRAELDQSVGPNARFIAGKKGYDIASSTTLSLVPRSFPLRVREIAAAIAGHHAQQAAEKKMVEVMATKATEAALCCHKELTQRDRRDKTSQAGVSLVSNKIDINDITEDESAQFTSSLQVVLPKTHSRALKVPSNIPINIPLKVPINTINSFFRALCNAAKETGALCQDNRSEETFPLGCGIYGEGVEAVTSTVKGTLHLVRSVRPKRGSTLNSSKHAAVNVVCEYPEGGNNPAVTPRASEASEISGIGQTSNSVMIFLTLLAKLWCFLYWAGEGERKCLVEAIGRNLKSLKGSDNLFLLDDLLHLAALAWDRMNDRDRKKQLNSAEHYWKQPNAKDGSIGEVEDFNSEPKECPVWAPAMLLVVWGIVSPLVAENTLITFIQIDDRARTGHRLEENSMSAPPSQAARIEMATALVKGYAIFFQESKWSKVLPGTSGGRSQIGAHIVGLQRSYHPLNFCRLTALLESRGDANAPGS